jgi:hypothetical protein
METQGQIRADVIGDFGDSAAQACIKKKSRSVPPGTRIKKAWGARCADRV